jgi:hypothetical protein
LSKDFTAFLDTLFAPGDLVEIRPVETFATPRHARVDWKGIRYERVGMKSADGQWCQFDERWDAIMAMVLERSEAEFTNTFFRVCPVFGAERYSKAWQTRVVRSLWLDFDNCTVADAVARLRGAGLPDPSIAVNSGHGAHAYLSLAEPYLIDDVGDPRPVLTEWAEGANGKRSRVEYIKDPATGERLALAAKQNVPALSPKAQHIQDVIAGVAAAVGADHTHDLARILRIPGTWNRKGQRDGQEPVRCELVTCDPGRRYPVEDFAKYSETSPAKLERQVIGSIPLPRKKRKTQNLQGKLDSALSACAAAVVGERSEADFHFACEAIEQGIDQADALALCRHVGKFHERGEDYFFATWNAAAHHTREKIFRAERQRSETRKAKRQAAETSDEPERPQIVIGVDESRVIDEAIGSLADRPIFQRGGLLVHIVRDAEPPRGIDRPKDAPRIAPVRLPRLRELMAEAADWVKPSGDDEYSPSHPPDWAVKAVDARGQWSGIRPLEGVVESPVLRADGSILQTKGYDRQSGLLFESSIEFPGVMECPSHRDAIEARDALLEVVADFPFADETHGAAWLAAVLAPLARHAFYGPAPLNLIDANTRGAGKSLLSDATALIVCGREMARMSAPKEDDELRKRITALALAAEPLILIDNIEGSFGSPALDAALTATTWSDRRLGVSEMVTGVPLRAVWFATGNNIVLVADTARRSLHIRIESPEENPEERSNFRHENLLAWVRQERPRLVCAALTILRAYCQAGRPDLGLRPWGSFEAWSALVRQAVAWCDMPDPGDTRQELATQADSEADILRRLINAWEKIDPDGLGVGVGDIIKALEDFQKSRNEIPAEFQEIKNVFLELAPQKGLFLPNAKTIGMKIAKFRRRVVAGRFLDKKTVNTGNLWFVGRVIESQPVVPVAPVVLSQPSVRKESFVKHDATVNGARGATSSNSTTERHTSRGANGNGSHLSREDESALEEFLRT